MEELCKDLIQYINHVDGLGGVNHLDNLYNHAICDCIAHLGHTVRVSSLNFPDEVTKSWWGLKVISTHHYLDLSTLWARLGEEAVNLLALVEEKLEMLEKDCTDFPSR